MYPEVAESDGPDRDLLLEHILLRFSPDNSTFKRTYSRRFDPVDEEVTRILREGNLRHHGALDVHDIGVSDGRTAVDFFRRLDGLDGLNLRVLATDRDPDVAAISSPGSDLVAVVNPDTHSFR